MGNRDGTTRLQSSCFINMIMMTEVREGTPVAARRHPLRLPRCRHRHRPVPARAVDRLPPAKGIGKGWQISASPFRCGLTCTLQKKTFLPSQRADVARAPGLIASIDCELKPGRSLELSRSSRCPTESCGQL